MYALERRINRRWMRFAVCGNRPLLDRVRAAQPQPQDWRVIAVPLSTEDYFEPPVQINAGQPAA